MREYWNCFGDGTRSPRREFLKAGLAAAAGLGFSRSLTADGGAAARARIGAARPTLPLAGSLGLLEVDSVDVWCLEDNYTDAFLTSSQTIIRPLSTPPFPADIYNERQLVTEHGFSALVTVQRNGQRATVLYDGGLSLDGVSWNMKKLGLSGDDIAAVVL